ncbi:MAG: hypothetical protein R6W90_02300 [Ignavibacteriaceae bacterium]
MRNNMPLFTKVKLLSLLTLIITTTIFFYSCKKEDDNPVGPDPNDEPAIAILAPANGDTVIAFSSYEIKWQSNTSEDVKIEFSDDNGSTWALITGSTENDGSFLWNPVPDSISVICRIRITTIDNSVSDISLGNFRLLQSGSSSTTKEIIVLTPNGGEEWPAKSSKVITWNSSQVSTVKIEYSSNNGVSWITLTENTESDGYYIWDPLPNIPSTNAKIKVSSTDNGVPSDASDAVFTVSPEEALSIIEPNGGEQWLSGSNQYIRWNGSSSSDKPVKDKGKNTLGTITKTPLLPEQVENVKLEYTTNSGSSWTLIAENIPNNGTYTWSSIPSINSTLCKIRISDMEDGAPFDLSDSSFTIYNSVQQEIAVTSPNGGEIWQAGTTQSLTWASTNITNVKIEYSINNGLDWATIVNTTPSDGFFSWDQVPNIASTICRIRISDADDSFPSDFSNAVFTIAPEPEITVISPNGGESIQANSTTNISWTSTNISHVKLEYTTNNGASWTNITASTESDGLFEWEGVPDISSSLCRIRISDVNDGQPYDISDGNFIISNKIVQSINLLVPNNNEQWETGTTHDIIWTGTAVDSVKIEFTTNNGTTWKTIAAGAPGSGSVEWGVPTDIIPPDANSVLCRIRVSDAFDGMPVDESNTPVTIKQAQSITVLYPNGGESKTAGDTIHFQWSAQGIERVNIEYTVTNSLVDEGWYVLATDVPSGGANGKLVASISIPSNECRIRISDAADRTPIDYSDGTFSLAAPPKKSIRVISPNAGENWLVDHTHEIRWSSTSIDRVKLEYTLNGGATWKLIDSDTESNGLYNFKFPPIDFRSDLCKVKITSVADTALYDLSDGFFSLFPRMLRVIFPNGGEIINHSNDAIDTVIQWTSAGVLDVKIEYTINNGVTWIPIVNDTPSTGAYRWIYPDITSTLARIRITDVSTDPGVSNPPLTDMSDSYFNLNITVPGLSIINPGIGKFKASPNSSIVWYGSEDIKKVNIEYSVDGGKNWKVIASDVPNKPDTKNQYLWKSAPSAVKGNALIRITDSAGKYKSASKKINIE